MILTHSSSIVSYFSMKENKIESPNTCSVYEEMRDVVESAMESLFDYRRLSAEQTKTEEWMNDYKQHGGPMTGAAAQEQAAELERLASASSRWLDTAKTISDKKTKVKKLDPGQRNNDVVDLETAKISLRGKMYESAKVVNDIEKLKEKRSTFEAEKKDKEKEVRKHNASLKRPFLNWNLTHHLSNCKQLNAAQKAIRSLEKKVALQTATLSQKTVCANFVLEFCTLSASSSH